MERASTTTARGRASDLVEALYERRLVDKRNAFAQSTVVENVVSAELSPQILERFLIEFCARGVAMTEPVYDWIHRAGARCSAIGMADLGAALARHAAQEAGHHEMMIADTHDLVRTWNHRWDDNLDAAALIDRPPSPGVAAYARLHEESIAGPTPYAQLGIEYEIELLSVAIGPRLLRNIAALCGSERVAQLSFLTDHVALDVGHTEFNRRQLNALLVDRPDTADALVAAGTRALASYLQFLEDCFEVANQ